MNTQDTLNSAKEIHLDLAKQIRSNLFGSFSTEAKAFALAHLADFITGNMSESEFVEFLTGYETSKHGAEALETISAALELFKK